MKFSLLLSQKCMLKCNLPNVRFITDFGLSHVQAGLPTMVDVSEKTPTSRTAHAQGRVHLPKVISERLALSESDNEIMGKKGPVLSTAVVAGVMAVKKTSDLIPFCHPIPIEDCKISIEIKKHGEKEAAEGFIHFLQIDCKVKTVGRTGVEMEALVGVSNTALCIYDMLKALSHDMKIDGICLVSKEGGKSTVSADRHNR